MEKEGKKRLEGERKIFYNEEERRRKRRGHCEAKPLTRQDDTTRNWTPFFFQGGESASQKSHFPLSKRNGKLQGREPNTLRLAPQATTKAPQGQKRKRANRSLGHGPRADHAKNKIEGQTPRWAASRSKGPEKGTPRTANLCRPCSRNIHATNGTGSWWLSRGHAEHAHKPGQEEATRPPRVTEGKERGAQFRTAEIV